jgi:hypothetical protein
MTEQLGGAVWLGLLWFVLSGWVVLLPVVVYLAWRWTSARPPARVQRILRSPGCQIAERELAEFCQRLGHSRGLSPEVLGHLLRNVGGAFIEGAELLNKRRRP